MVKILTINNYVVSFISIVYFILRFDNSNIPNIKKCLFFTYSYCQQEPNLISTMFAKIEELLRISQNNFQVLMILVSLVFVMVKKRVQVGKKFHEIIKSDFQFYISLIVIYTSLHPQLLRLALAKENLIFLFTVFISLVFIWLVTQKNIFFHWFYIFVIIFSSETLFFINFFILYLVFRKIYSGKLKLEKRQFLFLTLGLIYMIYKVTIYFQEAPILKAIITSSWSDVKIIEIYYGNLIPQLAFALPQFIVLIYVFNSIFSTGNSFKSVVDLVPPTLFSITIFPNSTSLIFAYTTLWFMSQHFDIGIKADIGDKSKTFSILINYLIFSFILATFKPVWSVINENTYLQLFSTSRAKLLSDLLFIKSIFSQNLITWGFVIISWNLLIFKDLYIKIRSRQNLNIG